MSRDEKYSQLLDEQIASARRENRFIEFKSNYQDPNKLGEYISALSNGACLDHEDFGYLYFGVTDKTLEVKGTTFNPSEEYAKGNQSLEIWLRQQITPRISFAIEEFMYHGEKKIVRFKIPAAVGEPTMFNWKAYIRVDSHTTSMEKYPDWMREIYMSKADWSAVPIEGATIDDLDPRAIKKAREGYKERYPELADESDKWSDEVFLDRAALTIDGQITRTTILLLGKEEKAHKVPHIAQIAWKCYQDGEIFGDIYTVPFILATSAILGRIRNYRFKIYPPDTMIPAEVWKYDSRSILEGLHNAVAHQDYTQNARILVYERMDGLTFESTGGFFCGQYEDYIYGLKTPKLYRNPALVKAMVNIKMIDSQGYGIHSLYVRQKDRYLPMPDYDKSTDATVVLQLPGNVIDENYSFQLIANTDMDLTEAVLLDHVQKHLPINDEAIALLRKHHRIEGRKPNIFVSKHLAHATGTQVEYTQHKGLDVTACEHMVLQALKDHGSLSRQDIDRLLFPILSDNLTDKQKKAKVSNLLTRMKDKLHNTTKGNISEWSLLNHQN